MVLRAVREKVKAHWVVLPFLALYTGFVFFEIASTIQSGLLIGGDGGEYLFTASLFLHGRSSVFAYEYPLLPALYTVVLLAFPNPVNAYAVSDLVTGLMLVALFVSGYLFFLRYTSSKIGRLAGAIALASIPLFMDEAGWGGQAQLLAFVFGVLALRRILDWGKSPRLTDGLFVGALVTLAALTEGWTAFFFVLTIAIYVVVEYRRAVLSPKVLRALGLSAAPVVVVFGLLSILAGSDVSNGLSSPWILYITAQDSALRLINRFAVDEPVLLYAYFALAIVWVAGTCLRLFPSGSTFRPLLLAASLAFIIQALLLTSIYVGDRGIYFAALPLALVFARVGASVPPAFQTLDSPPMVPRTGIRRPPRSTLRAHASATISFFAIMLLAVQVGYAGVHLQGALTYYATPTSEISQLTVLRGEPGNVALLGVNGNGGIFPYDFFTGTTVFAATEPTLYVSTAQRQALLNASLMEYATRWIDAGGIRVVDASGVQTASSPGVFAYTGEFDIQSFYLDDALLPITLSPEANHSTIVEEDPSSASSIQTSTGPSNTLLTNYTMTLLNLTKVVEVEPNGDTRIRLDFRFNDSFDRGIEIRLTAYPGATVLTTSNESGTFSVGVSEVYNDLWISQDLRSTVNLNASNISLTTFHFVPVDQWGFPELQFLLNASSTNSQNIQVNLTVSPPDVAVSPPTVVTENQWFRSLGIDWVVAPLVSGSPLLTRLASDPNLHLYRTTPAYEIYQIDL